MIAESPATAEARARLAPFPDLFAVLFFVAVGSLIDPALLPASLPWLAVILVLLVLTKTVASYLLARLARLPGRPVQLAVGLSQLGEFSFVLGSTALAAAAISADIYAGVLLAIVTSIAASTIGVRLVAPRGPQARSATIPD